MISRLLTYLITYCPLTSSESPPIAWSRYPQSFSERFSAHMLELPTPMLKQNLKPQCYSVTNIFIALFELRSKYIPGVTSILMRRIEGSTARTKRPL